MTFLCVSIFVHDPQQTCRDIARAIEGGAEMIELRIDLLAPQSRDSEDQLRDVGRLTQLRDAIAGFETRFIFTCRGTREGGESPLSPDDRLACCRILVRDERDRIDLEWKDYLEDAAGPDVIASAHDFSGRPADLTKLFLELQQGPSGVAKVAWAARSVRDNLEAFELMLAGQVKPTIAICMGAAGQISRVLAKQFGAFLTFASLDDSTATAPGQTTLAELKEIYRWDAISPQTRVLGVVGSPVAHSMSPAIHNAAFAEIGFDGVYVPLLVEPGYESFKAFMETFRAFSPLNLHGLSITIPHKENALRYAMENDFSVDELARQIGAVNTFDFSQLQPRATSTDYAAIVDTVCSRLEIDRPKLAGLRVAVVGAGGTGRTAVAALAKSGCEVSVFNRTADRAVELSREFDGRGGKVRACAMSELPGWSGDVVINTTSLGMSPAVDGSIFDPAPPALGPRVLVFDTVYNPLETKLLRQAAAGGARTVGGIEMFVRQAAGQFEIWTGRAAPMELMRQIVLGRLSPSLQ